MFGWKLDKEMKGITKNQFTCKRDGLTIRGTEYRLEGMNLKVAIISHGFMANRKSVEQYAKAFAKLGYAAYCFDFNGGCVVGGKSDGKTTEMSAITETRDLMAVIEYVKSLPYTDNNSVILMGCSQGGFVSAMVAAKLLEQIAGLILFYPALCIPDDARAGKMLMASFDPKNLPETISCGPMKLGRCYVEDVMHLNPYDEIKTYQGPVLLVHGTADSIVSISYSQRAYEVYLAREQGKQAVLQSIEGGGHGFSKKDDAIAIGHIRDFVQSIS